MATALVIEEERGTWNGHLHPHNGYFAGNFSRMSDTVPPAPARPLRRVITPAPVEAMPATLRLAA
jgi:hypothetical protein